MKKLISFLLFFSVTTSSFAILNTPPPLEESAALELYLREVYDNILPLLFQTTSFDTAETTDATVTDLKTITLSENESIIVETVIVGYESNGDRAFYHLEGLFYRNTAGNVTQQGATTSISAIESDASWNATLNADTTAQTVDIRITGVAATTIRWQAITKYKKVK